MVIITDYLNIKSINFRKLIDGDPIVLMMYNLSYVIKFVYPSKPFHYMISSLFSYKILLYGRLLM
ncbi:hypothetical protein CF050_08720 [Clostridium botulinum]|nr:hypothetical protein [Clostridium botulinum]